MFPGCDSDDVHKSLEEFELASENTEPIQILVFPPKNKKFRINENTQCLEIEPVQSSIGELKEETHADAKVVEDSTVKGSNWSNKSVELTFGGNRNTNEDINEKLNSPVGDNIEIKEVLKIDTPFREKKCFLKGCKWSPDGFCLLSNSEDNVLRLFEIPESTTNLNAKDVMPVLAAKEGGTIYDFSWYPKMCSSDPVSCVFASTSQSSPIHLWDAYTGFLRATYQPINQYDEVTAAYSLAFSPDGSKIYSGFKKFLRIFDISIPGRVSVERNLKQKGDSVFQTNIISCISVNTVMPNLYALGSYDKTLGIYAEPEGELQCLLKGHKGGVTQIMFSQDGIQLYSGARKDSEIICWDLRNPREILCILSRNVSTNQRIYFDISNSGSRLVTGSTDGRIIIYNTTKLTSANDIHLEREIEWEAHDDCVNGVHFHPFRSLLASSSGQYHRPESAAGEDEDLLTDDMAKIENSLKIWSLNFNVGKES